MHVLIDQQMPVSQVVLEAMPRAGEDVTIQCAGANRAAAMRPIDALRYE